MAWPSLVAPTPGTVITAAWAAAQVVDPLAWLRLMTGNADPPGTAYALISTGVSGTAWQKVTGDAIALGTIPDAAMQTQKVSRSGDVMTGTLDVAGVLTVAKRNDAGFGARLVLGGSSGQASAEIDVLSNDWRLISTSDTSRLLRFSLTSGDLTLPSQLVLSALSSNTSGRLIGASPPNATPGFILDAANGVFRVYNIGDASKMLAFNLTTNVLTLGGQVVFHTGNDGNGSGLDADLWRGLAPAQTTVGGATSAASLNGYVQGNATNNIAINNGAVCTGLVAQNSQQVSGRIPTATPTPDAIPIADAAGKLDAWVTPTSAAPVPSGLIAFIADGNLPTGWSFYTPANGRVIVAAGTASVANAQTFAVGGSYGGDWAHAHTVNIQHAHGISALHNHGASALGVTGATGASSDINGLAQAGGVNLNTTGHTHGVGTLDVNGTTDNATSSGTDNGGSTGLATSGVAWIPPSHALNAIRKN